MISAGQRFTPLQRLLHWLMAVCILAMLFIGVGMVSTVKPKYLTLVSIHKPLGIAILVLALVRLAVRLRYGAPSLPADLPEPGCAPSSDPTAERRLPCTALERALLPCFRVLCRDSVACRGGALPCAHPTRRRIRRDGARADSRRGRARRLTPVLGGLRIAFDLKRPPGRRSSHG